MERLTKRDIDGCLIHPWSFNGINGSYDIWDEDLLEKQIDRLAAYEDTGLEPQDIISAVDMAKIACALHELNAYKDIGPIDHIRDLIKAEKEGRLVVVLPCKVGDTVYEISNNTDACNGCQHYEGIYGSGESWCAQIDDVDLRSYPKIAEKPLCEKQFMEVVANKPEIDWIFTHRNDFGKTVFLTRAEAEAAMAQEGDSE